MKKSFAFGISFLMGLVAATSLPTSTSDADQKLTTAADSNLVSTELPAREPTAFPTSSRSRGS